MAVLMCKRGGGPVCGLVIPNIMTTADSSSPVRDAAKEDFVFFALSEPNYLKGWGSGSALNDTFVAMSLTNVKYRDMLQRQAPKIKSNPTITSLTRTGLIRITPGVMSRSTGT